MKMLHMKNVTLHHIKGLNYVEQFDLNEEMSPKTDVINEDKELLEEKS